MTHEVNNVRCVNCGSTDMTAMTAYVLRCERCRMVVAREAAREAWEDAETFYADSANRYDTDPRV